MAMAPSVNVRKKTGFNGKSSPSNKDFPAASGKKLTLASATAVTPPAKAETKFNPGTPNQVKSVQRREQAALRRSTPTGMPAATGSESAGTPKSKYPHPNLSSAAPASSTSDNKFKATSTSPPAYQAPVAGTKRGGVETRYQRDGLAMDRRK